MQPWLKIQAARWLNFESAPTKLCHDSDHSLEDAAAMLGFSSASAFAHWFRAHFDTTFMKSRQAGRP